MMGVNILLLWCALMSIYMHKRMLVQASGGDISTRMSHESDNTRNLTAVDYSDNKVKVRCDLCADQWLFVISTGRSGSTSLMTMLNLVPGIYISGENDGVVNTLLALWKNRSNQAKMSTSDAWAHTHVDNQGLLCTMQLYAKQILGEYNISSTQIIGFKEIRHGNIAQLEFFRLLFPCARFIINTRRDLSAQSKSGQYKRHRQSLTILKNETMNILKWASTVRNKKRLFLLQTEMFTVAKFNELLRWVGVRNCQYTGVHHSHAKSSFRPDNRDDVLDGKLNCSILTAPPLS